MNTNIRPNLMTSGPTRAGIRIQIDLLPEDFATTNLFLAPVSPATKT